MKYSIVSALVASSLISSEAAAVWRSPSAGSLVEASSVIAGFHKYVCKLNYQSYTTIGSLVYDNGKMICENYGMLRSQPTTNKEADIKNYQVLDAPNGSKWLPVAPRSPQLSGLALSVGKDALGMPIYICRTFTPGDEDTISGTYMIKDGKWACMVGLPDGPLTIPLSDTSKIDLLVIN
jgi:hypothetical protein